jgi:hypothetical protein
MTRLLFLAVLVFGITLATAQSPAVPAPAPADKAECRTTSGGPSLDTPNLAANCPDLFAWMKFIEVNGPVPNTKGRVLWQTWATDPDTFPAKPDPARCKAPNPPPGTCPAWPVADAPHSVQPAANRFDDDDDPATPAPAIPVAAPPGKGVPPDLGAIAGETIRRNRATFDYIVDNALWYQEGLKQRFNENFTIELPLASVEVKLNWLPMSYVSDPSRYFTVIDEKQVLQGLVAMHVTTKDLPNWYWATFEHVDNPGRCDYIGCVDSFGTAPSFTPPRSELKRPYAAEKLTPALLAMMKAANLAPVFQNYRLKGSQTDFTDSRGEPTVVGNSVTEYGFVPTASCITCHSRAGTDANGKKPDNLRIFGEKLGGQTFNGPPDVELFYDRNNPFRRYMMQADFVWAIPFRAQPIGGKKP